MIIPVDLGALLIAIYDKSAPKHLSESDELPLNFSSF
jgi:hypothetical protein